MQLGKHKNESSIMKSEHSMKFHRTAVIAALILITPILVLITPILARSQERIVTLDEAIDIALEKNRALKIAKLETAKADYQVSEAVGYALPSLTADGSYSRALKKPVFFLPDFQNPGSGKIIPIEIGADNAYQLGFTLSQVLFNAAVFTGVGTTKIYRKAAYELHRNVYNETVSNVKRAFFTVLYTKEVLKLTEASLKNAENNQRQVQILFDQGIVSNYDLIRAEVRTENTRPVVIESERNIELTRNNLKNAMGLPAGEQLDVSGELTFEAVDEEMLHLAEETLLENNASIQALKFQADVNEQMVSIYKAEYLPTLAAFGTYDWQAQNNRISSISGNDFVSSSMVGLSLSYNLFNGFQTTSRVDQAQVDLRKSEELLQGTKDFLQTRIQNIRYRLQESRRRIESQTRTVEQAQKGYEIAVTRYSSGSGTQLEVNDADFALANARVNRVQAIFDYNIARTDLEELLSLRTPPTNK